MCTLVAWIGVVPGHRLVVAANRDERLGRPALPPQRHAGAVGFVAPVDLVAGGSWWALGEQGLFVALTNRMGAVPDASRASRGELVTRVVQAASMEEAERRVQAIDPERYNGFHLMVTDGARLVQLVSDGLRAELSLRGGGLFVMSERSFDAAPSSRDARVRDWASQVDPRDPEALAAMLATHDGSVFDSLCIHLPEHDYGTRSSLVLQMPCDGAARMRYAEGPPCRTPFVDVPPQDRP
jgi:uncharacterized protein with NRDE domain